MGGSGTVILLPVIVVRRRGGTADAAPAVRVITTIAKAVAGRDVQEGRCEIDVLDDLMGDGSAGDPRTTDQKGHQDVRFVGLPLPRRQAVVPEVLAVVCGACARAVCVNP